MSFPIGRRRHEKVKTNNIMEGEEEKRKQELLRISEISLIHLPWPHSKQMFFAGNTAKE